MNFVKRLLKYIGKLFIAFLLMLVFIWFLIWSEGRRDSNKRKERLDEILPPLNHMLAEKYNPRDFRIEYAGLEEEGERVFHLHIVMSKEMHNSDVFLQESYEMVQIVSGYARQHPNHFTLNTEEKFVLTIDEEDYYINQFSALEFTNTYSYYVKLSHDTKSEYYNELVDITVNEVRNIKGLSVFDPIMRLNLNVYTLNYEDTVKEIIRMPNLKYMTMKDEDSLPLDEKKKYAENLHENGINSSLWQSLYG